MPDDNKPVVHLRSIARALEAALLRNPDSPLHWVAVIDEESLHAPRRVWEFDDSMLQVGMTDGNSEGMLLYVHSQASRYRPGELVPLLRIKVLCGATRAITELEAVWRFFNSEEFAALFKASSETAPA